MSKEYVIKVLKVDLGQEKVGIEEVDEKTTREYIGGCGLAAKILWEETAAATEPFSPENPLIFMVGPLTGIVPQSSHYTVCAISPATRAWGEAHGGGRFPTELRRTSFSGVVFKGRAKKPVYLYINNDDVQIRDASHLWGKGTYEVSDLLQQETDPRACVAAIGQAGENLVPIASIINDGRIGRAAARCGIGAVMGSKNLKALAVRGTKKPDIADKARLKASTRERVHKLTKYRMSKQVLSLAQILPGLSSMGNLPVKNWMGARFDSFVEKMTSSHLKDAKAYYCYTCPVGCPESHVGDRGREIVLECMMPLGSNCLIDNLEALEEAYQLCNDRYGMDTISVGGCIAFGMECFEKGLIGKEETGGIELAWGNSEATLSMVRQMGEARGFGKVLGQGVMRAAEQIGGNSHLYAIHTKGLEFPEHDPRAFGTMMIAYATANRGACHLESHTYSLERDARAPGVTVRGNATELGHPPERLSRLGFEGKADLTMKSQNLAAMINSLVVCDFSFYLYGARVADFTEWLNCVTGWDMGFDEFMKTGERIFNLKRLFNLRRGLSAKDDRLPQRFFTKRPEVGSAECVPSPQELQERIEEYYSLRGWTREGMPTKKKLVELGLPPQRDYRLQNSDAPGVIHS